MKSGFCNFLPIEFIVHVKWRKKAILKSRCRFPMKQIVLVGLDTNLKVCLYIGSMITII